MHNNESIIEFLNSYENIVERNLQEVRLKRRKILNRPNVLVTIRERILFHKIQTLFKRIKKIQQVKEEVKKGKTKTAAKILFEFIIFYLPLMLMRITLSKIRNW